EITIHLRSMTGSCGGYASHRRHIREARTWCGRRHHLLQRGLLCSWLRMQPIWMPRRKPSPTRERPGRVQEMAVIPAMRRWLHRSEKIARRGRAFAFAVALFAATAPAFASGPQDAIRSFYATLLTTMKEGPRLGESGRYAALAPVVQQVFDVRFMTRLAVGPD